MVVAVKGQELLEKFCDLNLEEDSSTYGLHCGTVIVKNELMRKINALQQTNGVVQEKKKLVEVGDAHEFKLDSGDVLRCQGRFCVLYDAEL